MSDQRPRICLDRYLPGTRWKSRRGLEAALLISKKWPVGVTLSVRFIGGTPEQHALVEQYALGWTQHANIKLVFDNAPDAKIRVGFVEGDGSWSYLGTDALHIPAEARTMNLGWLDEAVVLHEFGHALGLIHEHQNPAGGIEWNEEQVIADLSGPPNYWDEATIRNNVLDRYSQTELNGTQFDPASIMLYAFPPEWTVNGHGTDANVKLSQADIAFISSEDAYPFPPTSNIPALQVVQEIATGGTVAPGKEDRYRFTADSDGRYVVETVGSTDVVMSLYGPDSRTTLIASDDDSGNGRNARISSELTAGEYLVQIRHYNRTAGGDYAVKVLRQAL